MYINRYIIGIFWGIFDKMVSHDVFQRTWEPNRNCMFCLIIQILFGRGSNCCYLMMNLGIGICDMWKFKAKCWLNCDQIGNPTFGELNRHFSPEKSLVMLDWEKIVCDLMLLRDENPLNHQIICPYKRFSTYSCP